MTKQLISIALALFIFHSLSAQNLVPNPSFEQHDESLPKNGWMPYGAFNSYVGKWTTGMHSSPDIVDKRNVPTDKYSQAFRTPHHGNAMLGLGISDKNDYTYYEYVNNKLQSPLKKNHKYYVEFGVAVSNKEVSVRPYPNKLVILENIGIHFSEKPLEITKKLPKVQAHINAYAHRLDSLEKWQKISAYFIADEAYQYLYLGFFQRKESEINCKSCYFYIDDILLKEVEEIPLTIDSNLVDLSINRDDNIVDNNTEVGENEPSFSYEIKKEKPSAPIILNNVTFEFSSSKLNKKSFEELNKLIQTLKEKSQLKINIIGHTCNSGKESYNKNLSFNRAKSVYEYLIKNDVDVNRLSYEGKGSSEPLASNHTEEGRKINRRVEYKIIER